MKSPGNLPRLERKFLWGEEAKNPSGLNIKVSPLAVGSADAISDGGVNLEWILDSLGKGLELS